MKNDRYRQRQEQHNRARGKVTPTMRAEATSALFAIADASIAQHRREMAPARTIDEAAPHLDAIAKLTGGSGMTLSGLLYETDVSPEIPAGLLSADESWVSDRIV